MSSRLASFKGPSTPTSSPIQAKHGRQPPSSPSSPAKAVESPYHRKLRAQLLELRTACRTWDDLILIDGLKAAKNLVDTRTDLDNKLSLLNGKQPMVRLVGPMLQSMDERIAELDTVIAKLRKQYHKMNTVIDNLEALLADAHRTKGWAWVSEEPLWTTWTLEKFVSSVSEILRPYRRSLEDHTEIVKKLRVHDVSFEDSRDAINKWVEQPWLAEDGWDANWEDLCEAEIPRWDSR